MSRIERKLNELTFEIETDLPFNTIVEIIDSVLPAVKRTTTKIERTQISEGVVELTAYQFGKSEIGRAVVALDEDGSRRTLTFGVVDAATEQFTYFLIPVMPKTAAAWPVFRDFAPMLEQHVSSHGGKSTSVVSSGNDTDRSARFAQPDGLAGSEPQGVAGQENDAAAYSPEGQPRTAESHSSLAPPGMAWLPANPSLTSAGTTLVAISGALVLLLGAFLFFGDAPILLVLVILAISGVLALAGMVLHKHGRQRLVPESELSQLVDRSEPLQVLRASARDWFEVTRSGRQHSTSAHATESGPQPTPRHLSTSQSPVPVNPLAAVPTESTGTAKMLESGDLAVVRNPGSTGSELHSVAGRSPDLRAQIAVHPGAYPQLLDWLREVGDEQVQIALDAREASHE